MTKLHIDVETFSELDIKKVGAYMYVAHPSFEILLLSYQRNDGEVYTVRLAEGEQLPQHLIDDILDPNVIKLAHNAPFEVLSLRKHLRVHLDWEHWRCTMIMAAYLGLPLGLGEVAKVLHLDDQKDAQGKALIKYFSTPCKATKANGGRTRNLWHHHPEKWELYCGYNVTDVKVEVAIEKYCERLPQPRDIDWKHWAMDQRINDRGVAVDLELVDEAIQANKLYTDALLDKMRRTFGIENPSSLDQLKAFVLERSGETIKSLNKDFFKDWRPEDWPSDVAELLKLRELTSKASVTKYRAMRNYRQRDGRIRGQFQYYGANRTGREAGRGPQPQNLKKSPEPKKGYPFNTVQVTRELLKLGLIDVFYDDVADIVSKMVRTAFIAPAGKKLVPNDFSAIEARVISWMAGEDWQLEVFKTHGQIYEATASQMFKVPFELCTKESGTDYRAKGKVASLALGYQGSVGAMINMGALREGLLEEELLPIVYAWRDANPNIVKLWKLLEDAAKYAITNKRAYVLQLKYTKITFSFEYGYLFVTLPSGRRLSYYGAEVRQGKIIYWGLDQIKKIWTIQKTYGGKLAENITQAIARDCLFETMYVFDQWGFEIVLHVHDEAVVEAPDYLAQWTLDSMSSVMDVSPVWAPDLPLASAGFVTDFYRKD